MNLLVNILVSHLPDPPAGILWVGPACPKEYRLLGESGFDMTIANFTRENVNFPEGLLFDGIVFYQSAEYFLRLKRVLTKTRRFLNGSGRIIFCDALTEKSPVYTMKPSYLSRKLTMLLCESGFRILDRFECSSDKTDSEECTSNLGVFVARKDNFRIRSYMPGDEQKILPLFSQVFNTHRTMEHWQWKFRNNPFGSERISLCLSDEGMPVSQYAGYPVPFISSLENPDYPACFRAFHSGDTFTHPSVRRIGLGKTGLLARTTDYFCAAFLDGVVPFGFGFNTATIKKLGGRYLGYEFGEAVTCWDLNLSKSPLKKPGLFSKLFSGYDVTEVCSVDEEWDEFFDRVYGDYAFLAARDSAYIRWRYLECPDKIHRLFALRKKDRLMGWSVFSVQDDQLLWGDALFDRQALKGVWCLLYHVATWVFAGIKAIKAWFSTKPEWWRSHLLSLGFAPRPEPDGLTLCYRSFNNPLMDRHTVTERLNHSLYFTWGDSDLF